MNKLEQTIAPNKEQREKIHEGFVQYSYVIIIVIISLLLTFLTPFLTGCLKGDLSLEFPHTAEAWIIWIIIHVGQALANVGIFIMFKLQAKVNVRKDPNYLLAKDILSKSLGKRKYVPRSPKTMNRAEYIRKVTTVFITSLLSTIVISNLILNFDLITFISCIVSTITTIIFGWTTMLKNEIYWTEEYLDYAKYITGYKEESEE